MPAITEQPKDFAESLPNRRRRSGRLLHFENGKAGGPARRHRPGPRRLAPSVRPPAMGASSSSGPRSATTTGTSSAAVFDPKTSTFSPELRITDAPVPTAMPYSPKRPTAPSGWPGKRGPTARPTSYLSHSRERQAGGATRSRSATRRPTNGRLASRPTRAAASTSRSTLIRPGTTTSCSVPASRRHAQPPDHRGRDRPISRLGPAWRPIHAAEPGSPMKNATPNWGKDAVNLLDGKGSSLYRQSKVLVAVVEGDRVLPHPIRSNTHRLAQER